MRTFTFTLFVGLVGLALTADNASGPRTAKRVDATKVGADPAPALRSHSRSLTFYVTSWSEEPIRPGWKRVQVGLVLHNTAKETLTRSPRLPRTDIIARGFRYRMGPQSLELIPLPPGFAAGWREGRTWSLYAEIPEAARTYTIVQAGSTSRIPRGSVISQATLDRIFTTMRQRAQPRTAVLNVSQYVTVRLGRTTQEGRCIGLSVRNRGRDDFSPIYYIYLYVFLPSVEVVEYREGPGPEDCSTPGHYDNVIAPGTTGTIWFSSLSAADLRGAIIYAALRADDGAIRPMAWRLK